MIISPFEKENKIMSMKNKILTGLFLIGCTTMMLGNESIAAENSTKISIKAEASTVNVGKTLDLDSRIRPKTVKIKDRNIVWTSSNSKVAKVLDKYDDDTKIKGIKNGTATITVKIKNTSIKATRKITVKKPKKATGTSAYEKKITTYTKEAEAIYKEITDTTLAASFMERTTQYYHLTGELEELENKIDRLDDDMENDYRDEKLTQKQYRDLERSLDNLDNYLDTVDSYLERKFNYEFDD